MAARIGRNLVRAMSAVRQAASENDRRTIAESLGGEPGGEALPIVLKTQRVVPREGESWSAYEARVDARLQPLRAKLRNLMGIRSELLVAANSLKLSAEADQIDQLGAEGEVDLLDLDDVQQVVQMDDVGPNIELPGFKVRHPQCDGSGVRVAVLDSGIDGRHPYLNVVDDVETSGEPTAIPGSHGTHCAGSIASTDSTYAGIAPGVALLNVKVLTADGRGRHTNIVAGIDAAIRLQADVLSMSLGFNHLPRWSAGGHGWDCPDGQCPLCTAVNNAAELENVVIVIAAGNEHLKAETLRAYGYDDEFDTELGCPGQAERAVTVGALVKRTFLPADFSSRGPTSYGLSKPIVAAPGVNVTSTVPVPRDPSGAPIPNPTRSQLFGRKSGTSMATPTVAGAAALLIQQAGSGWTAANVIADLTSRGVTSLPWGANVTGRGRLDLSGL